MCFVVELHMLMHRIRLLEVNYISTKNTMAVKKVAAKNLKMAMLKKM